MKAAIKLLPLLFGFVFSLSGKAQNYQLFSLNRTYHYHNSTADTIYSLRIDSAYVTGTDSVLMFNKIVKPNDDQSWYSVAISDDNIFGKSQIKKPAGEFIFTTATSDTFRIQTNYPVGQLWQFCSNPSITATINSRSVDTVSTVLDSVLTINLSNGKSLRLSKNFGFLAVHPFITYSDSTVAYKELLFNSIPEAGLGLDYSDPFRIFDFQPGDMFGYETWVEYHTVIYNGHCASKTLWRILSRYDSPDGDSIVYQIWKRTKEWPIPGSVYPAICNGMGNAGTETLVITRNDSKYGFLMVPTLSFKSSNIIPSYGILAKRSFTIGDMNSRRNLMFNSYDSYLSPPGYLSAFINFGEVRRTFTEGLGLSEVYMQGSNLESGERLTCYQKGSEIWGNCSYYSELLSAEDALNSQKSAFLVFPNPFTNCINLQPEPSFSGNVEITLYSILGQKVHEESMLIKNDNQVMETTISNLVPGLYLLELKTNRGSQVLKLMKE